MLIQTSFPEGDLCGGGDGYFVYDIVPSWGFDIPDEYQERVRDLAVSIINSRCTPTPGPEETVGADQLYEWAEELIRTQNLDDGHVCQESGGGVLVISWIGEPEVPEPYRDEVSDLAIRIAESRCPPR
jgi:hypothetical protein